MTTIAFHKESMTIAVDSRKTKGNFIADDNHNKIRVAGDVTFILAGSECEMDALIDGWPMLNNKLELCGFVIENGVVKWISGDGDDMGLNSCEHNETAGSGADYAITAMDMGASAEDAVKMAMKRDTHTGGKVRVIEVK